MDDDQTALLNCVCGWAIHCEIGFEKSASPLITSSRFAMDLDDFFFELLTYECPFTGKPRCAVDPALDKHGGSQKRNFG